MEFAAFKDLLFKKAIESGFNECEIYYSNGESISITYQNHLVYHLEVK